MQKKDTVEPLILEMAETIGGALRLNGATEFKKLSVKFNVPYMTNSDIIELGRALETRRSENKASTYVRIKKARSGVNVIAFLEYAPLPDHVTEELNPSDVFEII